MKHLFRNCILILLAVLILLPAGRFCYADEVVFGDTDGDGELTEKDANCISDHFSRKRMMDAAAISRADCDSDGKITQNDVSMILKAMMSPETAIRATQSFSILVTSDLNGNAWMPTTSDGRASCSALNTTACIEALREENPNLLLFDAGGSIFGSAIADEYTDRTERGFGPITSLFSKLRYDAVLLGDEAFVYPSNKVRKEVNKLLDEDIPVLGANLLMRERTTFDPEGTLWNELSPYKIFEIPQDNGMRPLRLLVIGMTEPDLAPSDDEILPVDPVETYSKLVLDLNERVDYTVLIYHGNVEVDAQNPDAFSLRDFIKKTSDIDLVLVAHGKGKGVRSERNYRGIEVPIASLAGGAETVTKVSVSLREFGRPAILVEPIDTSSYEPDKTVTRIVTPYVNKMSAMMDAVVCKVEQNIDPFDPTLLCSSDSMEITHEMQLYIAQQWIDYHDTDLPNNLISIAYPYLPIGDFKEGTLAYRDFYVMDAEKPAYSLVLIRGCELRAWLSDYARKLMTEDTVYSLYGLSYLLNSMNTDSPLGFLEHGAGVPVDDDEVFTLILAERAEGDLNLKHYVEDDWIPYEDRIIRNISLPTPYKVQTLGKNPVVDALIAYLESVGTLKLKHVYSWILI